MQEDFENIGINVKIEDVAFFNKVVVQDKSS